MDVRIGLIAAGRIGGNMARLWAQAGHEVPPSYSREPARLEQAAAATDGGARLVQAITALRAGRPLPCAPDHASRGA